VIKSALLEKLVAGLGGIFGGAVVLCE